MEKIKSWIILILAGVSSVLGLLFVWQKRKAQTSEALLLNKETQQKVSQNQAKVDENNQSLREEAELRAELEKQIRENKIDESNPDNIIDFFNKRK